jgi:hypothetical protein
MGSSRGRLDPAYLQRINRMIAEQILSQQQQPVVEESFDEIAYNVDPEMPYLEGLSPTARYRDMQFRDAGRRYGVLQNMRAAIAEQKAAQERGEPTLREDVAMGVTRSPGGRVRTEGGGLITKTPAQVIPGVPAREITSNLPGATPATAIANRVLDILRPKTTAIPERKVAPARATLVSPYGTGSSVEGTSVPRGTFSFQDAEGKTITAPFAALKDPRFQKFMVEEETGRRVRGGPLEESKPGLSYEDILAQLEAAGA